jgi:cell division transport system permease protein
MLWTNTKRIIKSGFVNFWRNSFVSLSSILVMTVTLFVLGSIIFIDATLDASLAQIRDKVDINVYFVTTASEEEIIVLKNRLEELPEVESIEYVSREMALERFRARHENDQLTLQALEELGENPLGASLNIKARETSQYEGIANFLQDEAALSTNGEDPLIDNVNYFQNKAAIDQLTSIVDSAERFGFILTTILALATILITFNTIRLAIYTAREEIAVMRLVGASNAYIRGPFVFEGIMYGFLAGVITLVLFYPFTIWLAPATENFFGNINILTYYINNFGFMFLIIIGSGVILGAISSYLAVRKYLRV